MAGGEDEEEGKGKQQALCCCPDYQCSTRSKQTSLGHYKLSIVLQKESSIPTTDSDELSFQFDTEIKGGSMIALNGDDASGSTPKRDTGRGKSRLTVLVIVTNVLCLLIIEW